VLNRPLRSYQIAPAQAIVDAVRGKKGGTVAVMMARQAGKNETAAHVEALLLNLYRRRGGTIIKAAPTFSPQVQHSVARLESVFAGSALPRLSREKGRSLVLGRARIAFYSAAATAHVVGATASLLLEADEAQDIDEIKWTKEFRPMAASTNAPTVLWGTAWTRDTLLARTVRALRRQEAMDGERRAFCVPWERVADEVPAYGRYVESEMDRLGAQHPLIRTQYALQEIDEGGGMFGRVTQVLMRGRHARQSQPTPGRVYALLVDVAGAAETRASDPLDIGAPSARADLRDSTAASIVEVVRQEGAPPRFLVVDRVLWKGTPHAQLYGALVTMAEAWGVARLVVDATGVGAGLASFLTSALGPRVIPFVFTARSKSDLGWRFLGACNSGRFLDHRDDGSPEYAQFWRQVAAADYHVEPGPGQRMRWGVADPAIHDDLLISAALCVTLEDEHLGGGA